ncbi:sigma-70 family RNA polymerase sigma factor [Myxococcaceae bacterium GXIMD 01537]
MSLLAEDRRLLREFRRGDGAALARVYRAYGPHVARYLARRFASGGTANRALTGPLDLEAARQETFLRAFSARARQAYDGRRPFEAWLNGVARSAAVDALRAAFRAARPEWRPPECLTPEEEALREETRALVRRFLASLEAPVRRFVVLRFEEGLSQERAGAALGLSRQQARTREAQVRGALRRFLAREGWPLDTRRAVTRVDGTDNAVRGGGVRGRPTP